MERVNLTKDSKLLVRALEVSGAMDAKLVVVKNQTNRQREVGLALNNISGSATWSQNNFRVYKFVVSLANDNNAQGLSSTVTFTWEADNT